MSDKSLDAHTRFLSIFVEFSEHQIVVSVSSTFRDVCSRVDLGL